MHRYTSREALAGTREKRGQPGGIDPTTTAPRANTLQFNYALFPCDKNDDDHNDGDIDSVDNDDGGGSDDNDDDNNASSSSLFALSFTTHQLNIIT